MDLCEAYYWLQQGLRRQKVLLAFHQPLTASQMAKRIGIDRDCCSDVFFELRLYELVKCLNPSARRSRLYWLTKLGRECQRRIVKRHELPDVQLVFPQLNWNLYGWICYSHRSAIVKALDGPLQPAAIKRKARFQNPDLKMSANNVRDLMKPMLERGIIRLVWPSKSVHPKYELTEEGEMMQELLWKAEPDALWNRNP